MHGKHPRAIKQLWLNKKNLRLKSYWYLRCFVIFNILVHSNNIVKIRKTEMVTYLKINYTVFFHIIFGFSSVKTKIYIKI